jgi:hypothetical protein
MGNQYTQFGWALATAASIAVPSVLHAADSGRKIEEVIVTAERKEASIQDTSISAYVTRRTCKTLCLQRRYNRMMQPYAVSAETSGLWVVTQVSRPI